MTKDDILRELNARLDQTNEDASDLPSDEWQAYMLATVVQFNEEHGTYFNPFTECIGWVERRQQTI